MFRNIFLTIFMLSIFILSACHEDDSVSHSAYIQLNSPKPTIYILKNISSKAILLDRYMKHSPGMNAGWGSKIAPGKWSAILLNEKKFDFSCQDPTNYQKIPCKEMIQVLAIKSFKTAKPSAVNGSYWIAEDMNSCSQLQEKIKSRGFLLAKDYCSLAFR